MPLTENLQKALADAGHPVAACKIYAESGELRIFVEVNGKSLKHMAPLPFHCAVDPKVLAERVKDATPTIIQWANEAFRDAA